MEREAELTRSEIGQKVAISNIPYAEANYTGVRARRAFNDWRETRSADFDFREFVMVDLDRVP